MEKASPHISAVVCTRNRGEHPATTIESLLANTHPDFEVILLDQSTDQQTEHAVQHFCVDPRFKYHHTQTIGTGISRNLGVQIAQGQIVAYTDDDCTVPPDWLETMAAIFDQNPQVAVAFCNVDPAPYNPSEGFIPAYQRKSDAVVRNLRQKCSARGIGAGMALRRNAVLSYGNFDVRLGPGTNYPDCEDGDIAVRALLNGYWIYETARTAVIHDGFRNWKQGKELTKRNWIGIGAAYSKPIKCRRWGFLIVVFYEAFVIALGGPLAKLLQFQRPSGLFRQFFYFWKGFFKGLREPVDCRTIRFVEEEADGS